MQNVLDKIKSFIPKSLFIVYGSYAIKKQVPKFREANDLDIYTTKKGLDVMVKLLDINIDGQPIDDYEESTIKATIESTSIHFITLDENKFDDYITNSTKLISGLYYFNRELVMEDKLSAVKNNKNRDKHLSDIISLVDIGIVILNMGFKVENNTSNEVPF